MNCPRCRAEMDVRPVRRLEAPGWGGRKASIVEQTYLVVWRCGRCHSARYERPQESEYVAEERQRVQYEHLSRRKRRKPKMKAREFAYRQERRGTGMLLAVPTDPEHRRTDLPIEARVINWARWVREYDWMGIELQAVWEPELQRYFVRDRCEVYGIPHPPGDSVDELDAQSMEEVMVRLKRHRPRLYRAMWQRYVMRRDDMTGAQACRMPVNVYQDAIAAGLRWARRFG